MAILRACILCTLVLLPLSARAGCSPIAQAAPLLRAAAASDAVGITFLGHASFLIESPGWVRAVTDYNGINVPMQPPDIATMNHAHSTHYTDAPDPRIAHVLRGWREDGGPAEIDLTVGDMHVSNLPTNIRDWQGGTERYGNSIFVFESAGVCIAHLSHLHHLLTEQDLVLLGHIDVVMAPVDGVYTLSQQDVAAVLEQIHPRLVLPMHWFTREVVERFVALVAGRYDVRWSGERTLLVSRATLPERPTVVVLGDN
jgi:L-ascorbate metabolism protein UlaG (beta-lactamase superfamily)